LRIVADATLSFSRIDQDRLDAIEKLILVQITNS